MTSEERQAFKTVVVEMQLRVGAFRDATGIWRPLADPELAYDLKRWTEALALLLAEVPPPVEFDNHHNALACPYCNPKGLTFAQAPSWQPIESAPRDGKTWILVTGCNTSPLVLVAGYDPSSGMWSCYGHTHISPPTHWMPLPVAPLVRPPQHDLSTPVEVQMGEVLAVDESTIASILRKRFACGDPGSGLSMTVHEAHMLMGVLFPSVPPKETKK